MAHYLIELRLKLCGHNKLTLLSFLSDPVMDLILSVDVLLLEGKVIRDRVLKNFELVSHGQPLEPRQKFVDDTAAFVPMAHASDVNFDVVLPDQALRRQVKFLNIEGTAPVR